MKISISVLNDHDDMATVKGRPFSIPMSDNDCEELARIAAANGMKPAELLAAFIGDLTGGTYTNGSDEREKAADWLDRTCFSMTAPESFTKYLAERLTIDIAAESMDMLATLKEEMQEETEAKAAETAKMIRVEEENLQEFYDGYKDETEEPESEAEAMRGLQEYTEELNRMLGRNQDAPELTEQAALNILKICDDPAEAIMKAYKLGYAMGAMNTTGE